MPNIGDIVDLIEALETKPVLVLDEKCSAVRNRNSKCRLCIFCDRCALLVAAVHHAEYAPVPVIHVQQVGVLPVFYVPADRAVSEFPVVIVVPAAHKESDQSEYDGGRQNSDDDIEEYQDFGLFGLPGRCALISRHFASS